ncbi:MAG: PAS domain-containing protein [Candidatus Poribacteria bacterium]
MQDAGDPDVFDFVYWVDPTNPSTEGPQAIWIPGSRTAIVAAAAETLYLTAAESKRMAADGEIELHGSAAAAWLGVPLLVDDRLLGVARLLSPGVEDPYTPRDVEMMTYVGQQIALAIDRRQTQDALDHERQLFNALMDSTPDSIYFKDTESRYIRVNRVSASQLGVPDPEDVVGSTDATYNAASGAREFLEEEALIISTGEALIGKVQTTNPDETGEPQTWIHVTKAPMRDADGEIVGLVGVSRDINELVHAQMALTQSESQRAALVQRIVTVQEEERARIARELHDQVGQELTSVLLGLRAAERVPAADSLSFIADARKQTSATLETVRQIAFDMHPSSMQDVGLAAALERDLVLLGQQAGLDTSFRSAPGAVPDLSKERQVGLYRMVHAALTNTVQHGQAESVSVVLTSSATQVSVMVGDDGVGFDVDAVLAGPVEGRFGLLALDERARMLKGRVSVESSPGEGAAVFIEIPTEAAL